MNKISIIIALLAVCIFFSGCQEAQKPDPSSRARASIEGIKITDLIPPDAPEPPKDVSIRVLVYEIPSRNNDIISEVFSSLQSSYLRFASHKTFKANGFEAVFGQNDLWPIIDDALGQASAQNVSTNNLLFLENFANDVAIGRSYTGQSFYQYSRTGKEKVVKLPNGELAWRINARALSGRNQVALVQIRATHKQAVLSPLRNIPGYENTGEMNFSDISIKLNMSPGDFIVIGPTLEESDQITLGDMYFKRQGRVFVRKTGEELKQSNNRVAYKVEDNVPLTRLYIIACMGVGN